MSSLAELTPQFLGQLCFIRNMSGIDQQLIHYVHPLAVLLILITISMLAKKSLRFSSFVSKGIINFICFIFNIIIYFCGNHFLAVNETTDIYGY